MLARIIPVFLLPAALLVAEPSLLDRARQLQHQGKLAEARAVLRKVVPDLRASGDKAALALALSTEGSIAVALGDYRAALADCGEALKLRHDRRDEAGANDDFNTLGLANQYLGNYPAALDNYQQALRIDRAQADYEGEIIRLNNIGNVFYFQGRYVDALHSYQQAFDKVNANSTAPWVAWRRQLTLANLATLYQRVGKEQRALELYQQLAGAREAMPANEHAQVLLNEGVLYRRLGDPVKALELYHAAQALFARDRHRDGEIGAWRNIGIAQALDLNDLPGAQRAFTAALSLAQLSSNTRGIVHARLYLAEVQRRLHHPCMAEREARAALIQSQKAGLVEEQWMSFYALGTAAAEGQRPDQAVDAYRRAIQVIESLRAGLTAASLQSEFLADKRDVYDALIALRLRQSPVSAPELFRWIERGRARTLEEKFSAARASEPSLEQVQSHLASDTLLVDYWVGDAAAAALWITPTGAGVVQFDDPATEVHALAASLEQGSPAWQASARGLGSRLLAGLPAAKHLIVVPDGSLYSLPFETLFAPGSKDLLVERCDISYLTAAQFVARPDTSGRRGRLPPWRRAAVAIGDPPVAAADSLAGNAQWQPLPASADEVRGIAGFLPGKTEVHLGINARKEWLLGHRLAGVPILHLSTHAVVDSDNPDRSRILLAPERGAEVSDYLFQRQVYDLDLKGVDLVTISACDTARGKMVRGEGIQAFSQAFLSAGASATVTSLWRVGDRSTAAFMQQFYYYLARGETKTEALRAAKLAFLHGSSGWAHPRYWAAFVLYGDGWDPCARVIPAAWLLSAAGLALAAVALQARWRLARR